jgi:hypothetical protein
VTSRILADPFWAYMADYVSSRGRVSVAEYLGPDLRLRQKSYSGLANAAAGVRAKVVDHGDHADSLRIANYCFVACGIGVGMPWTMIRTGIAYFSSQPAFKLGPRIYGALQV